MLRIFEPPIEGAYMPEMSVVRRRRTHRRIRPAVQVDHAAGGQRVDIGSRGVLVAIAAHVRAVVFTGEPENVRAGLGVRGDCHADCRHAEQRSGENCQPCDGVTGHSLTSFCSSLFARAARCSTRIARCVSGSLTSTV